jgi:hypothetical protein
MRAAALGVLLLLVGALLWLNLRPSPVAPVVGAETADGTVADAIIADLLTAGGLEWRPQGAPPFVATLRPAGDPLPLAAAAAARAQAAGVEAYQGAPSGQDVELRLYVGAALRYHLTLLAPSPPRVLPPVAPNRRERPALVVVIGGLGRQSSAIPRSAAPLSLAVIPFGAFSLRVALDGMQHHHEILADVRGEGEVGAPAVAAVPWASGLLVDRGTTAVPALPMGVAVGAAGWGVPLPEDMGRVELFAARPGQLGAMEALGRAQDQALSVGLGGLLIEAEDPDLPQLLAWLEGAEAEGWRLVLASEAGRPEALVGPPATIPASPTLTPPQESLGSASAEGAGSGAEAVRSSP